MNTNTSSQATLLIIDDAPEQVRLLLDFLTAQGFKVFSALNGTEGLLQIEQHHPDLILLDVMMPNVDGLAVCRILKSQEQARDIPIIFLTALNDSVDTVTGLELGVVDYISKPLVLQEVLARVNIHLTLRRQQQPLVGQNQQLQQEIERRKQTEASLHYMDLTPRKQVEEKLDQEQALLRLVIDTVPQLIFWKNRNCVYLGCNQNFAQVAGLNTPAQLVGRQDSDLPWHDADQIAPFRTPEMAVMDSDKSSLVVELFSRPDGSPGWWEIQRIPLHDVTGTVIGVLGSLEDITKSTQLTEELQARGAYLQQARDTAEMANRTKSIFLSNMSHELRTPLNAILGFTQILKRDNTLTSQQQEGIAVIHRNGEYLLTLINEVLDLAKVEAGKLILYPSEFHLEEFLQSLVDLFRSRAEQTKIQFSYQPSDQLPSVIRADETRLRQVLINLLGNAFKFTKQGGVTLRVQSRAAIKQEEDSILHSLHVEIEDTGIGMAPADLDKIFLPFQQVNDPTGPRDGTGLGLPITKKLLNMMGCELQIKSILGEGSLFWFDLQVLELFQTTLALRPLASPVIIGFVGPPRKILIVDDSWENSLVLVNLLKVLGFELKTVNNGKDSIDLARDWQPDLVLMDLVMAGIDGFEATRRIKRHPGLSKLPVVAVSASAFEFHKQASFEAGCDNFISKPVHLEELLACLQKHLQLTWIYTITGLPLHSKTEESPSLSEDEGLSKEQAAVLLDLGRRANLYGLIDFAKSLEQADEKWSVLAKQIQQLAKSYQMAKICELAQKYV